MKMLTTKRGYGTKKFRFWSDTIVFLFKYWIHSQLHKLGP